MEINGTIRKYGDSWVIVIPKKNAIAEGFSVGSIVKIVITLVE
jgi:antitoxin component of MazEF toxin-antitoxin module